MKKFLLALLVPVVAVALLNGPVLWTVLKSMLARTTHPAGSAAKVANQVQADNTLSIPVIGLSAPVLSSPADPTRTSDWHILKSDLMAGVSLAEKFALPGQNGTTMLLGHSSDLVPHRYSAVFAGLNNLRAGDAIDLRYKGKPYRYIVESKQVVSPIDPLFEAMRSTDHPNKLVLITCWPLLTTAQRLIVTAYLQ